MQNTIIDIKVVLNGCGFPKYEGTAIYVRTKNNNVLIDTGAKGDRGQLILNLSKLSIQPQMIDAVLFTHMHIDHIGNYDLFPNAIYYTTQKEYDDYDKVVKLKEHYSVSESLNHIFTEDDWGLLKNNSLLNENKICIYDSIQAFSKSEYERVSFFRPGEVLLDFFITIPFKGHSVESVGYLMNWNGKKVLAVGDIISSRRAYERHAKSIFGEKNINIANSDIDIALSCADIVIPGHGLPFEIISGKYSRNFLLG